MNEFDKGVQQEQVEEGIGFDDLDDTLLLTCLSYLDDKSLCSCFCINERINMILSPEEQKWEASSNNKGYDTCGNCQFREDEEEKKIKSNKTDYDETYCYNNDYDWFWKQRCEMACPGLSIYQKNLKSFVISPISISASVRYAFCGSTLWKDLYIRVIVKCLLPKAMVVPNHLFPYFQNGENNNDHNNNNNNNNNNNSNNNNNNNNNNRSSSNNNSNNNSNNSNRYCNNNNSNKKKEQQPPPQKQQHKEQKQQRQHRQEASVASQPFAFQSKNYVHSMIQDITDGMERGYIPRNPSYPRFGFDFVIDNNYGDGIDEEEEEENDNREEVEEAESEQDFRGDNNIRPDHEEEVDNDCDIDYNSGYDSSYSDENSQDYAMDDFYDDFHLNLRKPHQEYCMMDARTTVNADISLECNNNNNKSSNNSNNCNNGNNTPSSYKLLKSLKGPSKPAQTSFYHDVIDVTFPSNVPFFKPERHYKQYHLTRINEDRMIMTSSDSESSTSTTAHSSTMDIDADSNNLQHQMYNNDDNILHHDHIHHDIGDEIALVSYFEVTVLQMTHAIAIGISYPRKFSIFSNHSFLGWKGQSYGYHSDDGKKFSCGDATGHKYYQTYGTNDVIGCGLDWKLQKLFYTKNGAFIGYAFDNVNTTDADFQWFPCVSLTQFQDPMFRDEVSINFGLHGSPPFRFDLTTYDDIRQSEQS